MTLLYELFSNIKDPVLITTRDHQNPRVIYINSVFTEYFGYSKRDILGKTPKIMQGPKTDRRTLDKIKSFLKDCCEDKISHGQKLVVELVNYTKEGVDYWNELTITNIKTATESVFLSFSRLANTQSELELALHSTEGDYNNPILFIGWSIDVTWSISSVSRSCNQLLGYDQLDLINKSFKSLIDPDDYKSLFKNSNRSFWEQRIHLLGPTKLKKTFNGNFYKGSKKIWAILVEELRVNTVIYSLVQYLPGAFAIVSYSKRDRSPIIRVSNNQFKNLFNSDKDGTPLSDLLGNNLSSVAAKLFLNGVTQINQEFPYNGMILDVLFSVVDNPNEHRILIVRVRDRTDVKKALAESEALKSKIHELQTMLEQSEHSDRSKLDVVRSVVGNVNIGEVESIYKSLYEQLANFSNGLDSISSQNALIYKLLNDNKRGLPGVNKKLIQLDNKPNVFKYTLNTVIELVKEHPKLIIYTTLALVVLVKAISTKNFNELIAMLERFITGESNE